MPTQGPNFPTAENEDDLAPPGLDCGWQDLSLIEAADGNFAFCPPGGPNTGVVHLSAYMQALGFNFSIPSTATINGILVEINRRNGNTGSLQDYSVKLLKGGTYYGSDRASAAVWPFSFATVPYGGATDLWGGTWTPADINANNFGIALSVIGNIAHFWFAEVDFIRVTVYYGTPSSSNPNPPLPPPPSSPLELTIVYSGGESNSDPSSSYGGGPSAIPISNFVNNLFDDIESGDQKFGLTDYRAFYVFNDSFDNYSSVAYWVDAEDPKGSEVFVGTILQNEIQTCIFNNVASGSFIASLDGSVAPPIAWDFDMNVLASNIQTSLNQLPNAVDVIVTPVNNTTFSIEWSGINGNKKFPVMQVVSKNFAPLDPFRIAEVGFAETQPGSPINAITPDTGNVMVPPTGIQFGFPDAAHPVIVGFMEPGEGFAIWLQRISPPQAPNELNDFITLKFSAYVAQPSTFGLGNLKFHGFADVVLA